MKSTIRTTIVGLSFIAGVGIGQSAWAGPSGSAEWAVPSIVATVTGLQKLDPSKINDDCYLVEIADVNDSEMTRTWYSIGPIGIQNYPHPKTGVNMVTSIEDWNKSQQYLGVAWMDGNALRFFPRPEHRCGYPSLTPDVGFH